MKGWSDRDTNPQWLGQKQHAKQWRHLPPSIPQERTKPNSQMRTVFTPNTSRQNHLRDKCLLARMGAIWSTGTTGESWHMAALQQQWRGDRPTCLHQVEDLQTAWLVAVSPSDQPHARSVPIWARAAREITMSHTTHRPRTAKSVQCPY